MFRRYQDTSCWTNCECEFGFLAGRISAIRFQSTVLLDLQGEGRLISCARKKKIEHVALSRLPGRWGSLDFNKKVLLFLLRLLLRIRAASPRFLPPTCRHHGHQYSPRPRSKCQLKWRNTRARDYISSCLARTRPNTLASTAQAVDTCGSEPYLELQVTLGTYGPEHTPERRPE